MTHDDRDAAVRALTDVDTGGPAAVVVLAESWQRALRILRLKDATLAAGSWPARAFGRPGPDGSGGSVADPAVSPSDLVLAISPPIPVTVCPPWTATPTRGTAVALRIGLGYGIGVAVRLAPTVGQRTDDHQHRVYDPAHITHVELPL